jgi:CTP synthase
MPDQQSIADMGGTMRLGRYPCAGAGDQKPRRRLWTELVSERHRHRFEFNNAYREMLGTRRDRLQWPLAGRRLVEIAELRDHPWMVGSQFHPEFKSRLQRPHPLFKDFVGAAIARRRQTTLEPS